METICFMTLMGKLNQLTQQLAVYFSNWDSGIMHNDSIQKCREYKRLYKHWQALVPLDCAFYSKSFQDQCESAIGDLEDVVQQPDFEIMTKLYTMFMSFVETYLELSETVSLKQIQICLKRWHHLKTTLPREKMKPLE